MACPLLSNAHLTEVDVVEVEMPEESKSACAVCGWVHQGDNPVDSVVRFCACCGIERGVQDRSAEQVKTWRSKWLMGGGRWRGTLPETAPMPFDRNRS